MTSLIAWISIDQRAPSAFYLASDSRISWESERARWDTRRKLFTCHQYADVFGYCGDVFPSLVLGQIAEAADTGLLFHNKDDADRRHAKFSIAVKVSFGRAHNTTIADFQILHGSRQSFGRNAQFKLWRLSFAAKTGAWTDSAIAIPQRKSTLLDELGSGAKSVRSHSKSWGESSQGGTSRAIFSAFCDSIRSGTDPFSGGVPQVVGMYHTRMPQAFGIVHDDQRYLHGFPLPQEVDPDVIEWRDELFQRIDGKTLKVLSGAQRHTRPNLK